MEKLIEQIRIQVNENVYLKNPNTSELGERIIRRSIFLIDEMGLESFTFKKLAIDLNTTESSIYRYFENKHKLLIYLTSWYWSWLEYNLVFSTANISDADKQLEIAINLLCKDYSTNDNNNHINLGLLQRIVHSESSKAFLTKEVDQENETGFFESYKRLVNRLCNIIEGINKDFEFPHILSSTIIEGIIQQKYFSNHIPSLTDFNKDPEKLSGFFIAMALNTIKATK